MKIGNSKKGAAIEMAIVFMVVIFAFCAVITTISFTIRMNDKKMTEIENTYFSMDQLGDDFVGMLKNGKGNQEITIADEGEVQNNAETKGDWMRLNDTNYGICIDSQGELYTMRVVRWGSVDSRGNFSGNPELIVTAQTGSSVKVINWSTSQNKYTTGTTTVTKDVPRESTNYNQRQTKNYWKYFWEFLRNNSRRKSPIFWGSFSRSHH